MVSQRKSSWSQPYDQRLMSGLRAWDRPAEVQWVPSRQQAVDLEAPRQFEHIFQSPRLDLRDVHRVLFLVNTRLHAVVADAVAGRGAHWLVDRHAGQRADWSAALLYDVHLGDLLVERASCQLYAENARVIASVLLLQAV